MNYESPLTFSTPLDSKVVTRYVVHMTRNKQDFMVEWLVHYLPQITHVNVLMVNWIYVVK